MHRPGACRPSTVRAAVAALAALALARCAHAPLGAAEASAAGAPAMIVTGSRIPQRVDLRSGIPATISPVRIWSRQDLDRAGTGSDLAAALSMLDPAF